MKHGKHSKHHKSQKQAKATAKIIKPISWIVRIATILVILVCMYNINGTISFFTDKATSINEFSIKTSYTITFNSNTGSGTMNPQELSYNEATNLNANSYTKAGYAFNGWNTKSDGSGTSYADGQSVTDLGDITLYAQWSLPTYNIEYILDGGTVATNNPDTYTKETPTFTLNNPTKTGYSFKGWSGTGLTGNTNTTVTISKGSTGDRSYTANYTGNKYYIRFNSNSGSGSMSNQTMTYGVSSNLTANKFTKSGYEFAGWNTQTDGTGTSYKNQQSVSNLTATNGAKIDLYAQWKKAPTKYAVQIYGINQDVDANGNTLGLTFGPATGANYNNAYVTHTYELYGPGKYRVKIITHTVASNGSETTTTEYLKNSSNQDVTRTQAQVNARENISLHDMTWTEIAAVSDKTVFEDCMLCGDTKSVSLTLNSTIAKGSDYNQDFKQYGDGAGTLYTTLDALIEADYTRWNYQQNTAKNEGGYSSSRIRATLIGKNSKTNTTYAGTDVLDSTTCLYSCIESDLRNVITAKKIKYVTGTSTSSYTSNTDIADSIWLFSEREMYGTGEYSGNTTEGLGASGDGYNKFGNTESKYYISSYNNSKNSNRIIYNEKGSYKYVWLRSIMLSAYTDTSRALSSDGGIGGNFPNNKLGLTFGFCIR